MPISPILKRQVVAQDIEPSSPFLGMLWRDTSADTLKQWDGSKWVSVQSSPDGESIIINSEGNLQVNKEKVTIIGDWEAGTGDNAVENNSDWSEINETDFNQYVEVRNQVQGAESTSNYVQMFQGWSSDKRGFQEISTSKDLSDYDKLICYIKGDTADSGMPTRDVEIAVSGNVEFSDTGRDDSSWKKIEIDVTGYNSTETIQIRHLDSGGSSSSAFGVDRVKLLSEGLESVSVQTEIGSGAGN